MEIEFGMNFPEVIWLLAATYVVYCLGKIVYRLTFHPLAGFPGPKLAAASYLYELYFEVFVRGGGQYTNEIERMHDMLGPVVRVTPDEVHVRDPDWAFNLYAGPRRLRIKDPLLSEVAGTGNGCFGTSDPRLHRPRRAPVGTFYSRHSISRMQGKIWQRADHLCAVLRRHLEARSVVEGSLTFLAWSNDSLRTFTFGHCLSLLDNPDQAREFLSVTQKVGASFGWLHFMPGMTKLGLSLPPRLFEYIKTPLNFLVRAHVEMINAARESHREQKESITGEKNSVDLEHGERRGNGKGYDYLFQAILSSSLPESEKDAHRMAHEGLEMVLAGSDPAARTLCVLFYHLLANPAVLEKLRAELRAILPEATDTVDIRELESSPYLNACLKEALRLGQVVDHRLGLIAPEEDLVYQHEDRTWVMRRGVTISMTPARAGLDEGRFLDPRVFNPDRWIPLDSGSEEEQRIAAMNRAYMPFAKGTRNCLGEFFAMTEMRVAVARMFRTFEFELWDTIRERDVDVTWSHITGESSKDGKGVRFRVIGLQD